MALYEVGKDSLKEIRGVSLQSVNVRERQDLQRLLRDQIEVLDDQLLVIAEEFGNWEESRRRIDLLAIDRSANLVVVELKRDETGGHMELQAVRYAAMISAMTWDRAVEAFADYLKKRGFDQDAGEVMLDFLEWDEADEDAFGQEVRILLVAADFGRELTTAVLWLNERDVDIRCVRLQPYSDGQRTLLNVQQVIPLPEAEDFQIQIREKVRREREARRTQNRDLTRFDLEVGGQSFINLPKRTTLFNVVQHLIKSGVSPEKVAEAARPRAFERIFRVADGRLGEEEFNAAVAAERESRGKKHDPGRFFTSDDELFHGDGKTYAFSKMWGGAQWHETMERLKTGHPSAGIRYVPHEAT